MSQQFQRRPVAGDPTGAAPDPQPSKKGGGALRTMGYAQQVAALAPPSGAPAVQMDATAYPKTVEIEGEQVEVASEAEQEDARRIIKKLEETYGVDVSSEKSVRAITDWYDEAPQEVRDSVKTEDWKYKELQALERALDHFAPILGDKRKTSKRKDDPQEVLSVGKANASISGHSDTATLDGSYGQFFKDDKNFTMTKAGTDLAKDFGADNDKQLEGTAVHEMCHGIFRAKYDDWASRLDYWTDASTKSGADGAEEPPTPYGKKNAREDLCETAMYYFVDKSVLEGTCPKRIEIMDEYVAEWTAGG